MTDNPFKPQDLLIYVGLSLVVLQAGAFIFKDALGSLKLGPAFIVLALVVSAYVSIMIANKMIGSDSAEKADIVVLIIVTLVTLLVLFGLKTALPELFPAEAIESMNALEALLG